MNTTHAFEAVAIVAIIVSVAAGVGIILLFRRLQRYLQNQRIILGSRGTGNVVEHVAALDAKLNNLRIALENLTLNVRDHGVRIDSCLSRIGMVRFDAYEDLGGRQSTSVAFLDSHDSGVVITTVVSRDFARMYVKWLKNGTPDIPLAPEEIEAIEQAKANAPFTLVPRTELQDTEREPKAAVTLATKQGEQVPGQPSTLGWPQPTTPAGGTVQISGKTLAERFLVERRARLRGKQAPLTSSAPDSQSSESEGARNENM